MFLCESRIDYILGQVRASFGGQSLPLRVPPPLEISTIQN